MHNAHRHLLRSTHPSVWWKYSALISLKFVNRRLVPDPGKATLWTTVQTGTAIICACLPIYRPLFSQPHVLSTKFKSWNSSLRNRSQSRKSKTNAPSSNPSNANAFDRRDNGWKGSSETPLVDAKSTTLCPASDEVELSYPMNAIAVETRIDIVWQIDVEKMMLCMNKYTT